jgi:hypothetical protein
MPMTESDWLACANPRTMLYWLGDRVDRRRALLFACACERRLWDQPDCDHDKVTAAERYADGQAPAEELFAVLEDIGIDGITLESVTEMDPVSWATYESEDSAGFAANLVISEDKMHTAADERTWQAANDAERAVQSDLLRDIFGNPFRPAAVDPAWLTWRDGTVRRLAEVIYAERRFADLPVLADALEEAGCDNPDILNHCRGGEHVRGCWVVDLLLGMG